ncbi:MAG: hypothetical protein IH867_04780 [Chloroflexi bacterium]|nr:hypothetical protein [Chloroflexota bacterium]
MCKDYDLPGHRASLIRAGHNANPDSQPESTGVVWRHDRDIPGNAVR